MRVNSSRFIRIENTKFSMYHFEMDPNGLLNGYFYVDCQICISVPLKLYTKEKILMIAIQDKFILIKFSSCIKLHKELGIFCFARVHFLDVVCSQAMQVKWLTPKHLIMVLKLFRFPEVFIW